MNARDKVRLAIWLKTGATLREVENTPRVGLVGNERFTERTRDWFRFFWTWSAPRFAGVEGWKHDRAYARLGRDAYNRRLGRVKRMAASL